MNEGGSKNEKPKPKQVPETWSTDHNIIREEQIKKIQQYVNKNILGVERILSVDELLDLMKNVGNVDKFTQLAENYNNDNPSNLIKDLNRYIEVFELSKIKLKSLIDESRDNADLSLMIRLIDQRRLAGDLINSAKRKINEIKNEN